MAPSVRTHDPSLEVRNSAALRQQIPARFDFLFHLYEIFLFIAIEMAMSNPSYRNVETLFNLMMIDLIATTNMSSFHEQYAVQKNPLCSLDRTLHHFCQQCLRRSQLTIKLEADGDGSQIPNYLLSFPVIHQIVPYSHFQWPVYAQLLRPAHPVGFHFN